MSNTMNLFDALFVYSKLNLVQLTSTDQGWGISNYGRTDLTEYLLMYVVRTSCGSSNNITLLFTNEFEDW